LISSTACSDINADAFHFREISKCDADNFTNFHMNFTWMREMYIIFDDEEELLGEMRSGLQSFGVETATFRNQALARWIDGARERELAAVKGFILSGEALRHDDLQRIRTMSHAPILTVVLRKDLTQALQWLSAGADDVLPRPTHAREIIARVEAIWRRSQVAEKCARRGRLVVYFDGSDPLVDGVAICLPRRERNILEYLVRNAGRRMSKLQIFHALYGPLATGVDESVIEAHVSKLRRRLRERLGHEVIDAKRYLGYRFIG